jgi:hypothetical protein
MMMIIIRLIIQFTHRHLLVYNPLFLLDSCDVVVRKEEGNHTAHLSLQLPKIRSRPFLYSVGL